jgi:hypothetical protein
VIGTALEPFGGGTGRILVFVNTGWFSPGETSPEIGALRAEVADLRAALHDLRGELLRTRDGEAARAEPAAR